MTYRIHIESVAEAQVLGFEGLLDEAALADLRERIASVGLPVRLVLRAGTEVAPTCVEPLRRLPASLRAESPAMTQLLGAEPS